MKLISWIPNEFYEKSDCSDINSLLYYDIIEDYTPEHSEFNTCPIKLRKILKWAKISNGEKTFIVAYNERTDGSLVIVKKIV
jgi:hypothetical protein